MPINLRSMAAMGVLPGDVVIAHPFVAAAVVAAASMFGGGGVGVCDTVALLGESWILINCTNTKGEFCW